MALTVNRSPRALRAAGCGFVACYSDLNQFKPFNDICGQPWR